jgi:hypothetical protein
MVALQKRGTFSKRFWCFWSKYTNFERLKFQVITKSSHSAKITVTKICVMNFPLVITFQKIQSRRDKMQQRNSSLMLWQFHNKIMQHETAYLVQYINLPNWHKITPQRHFNNWYTELVEVLCYKPKGCGYDSWWGHWIFFNLPNPSSRSW